MPKPTAVARVIRKVENWPEVVSLKLALGRRDLTFVSFRDGVQIACRRRSCDWDVIREIFIEDGYGSSFEYLSRVAGPATVLDLGANIGCFSLRAAATNPLLEVCAYEPGPPNAHLFRMNCLANPELASRVRLHEEAAGGDTRRAEWSYNADNPGGSSLFGGHALRTEVQIRAFGDIVRSIPEPIALVKIDIEGAEYELIEETPEEAWAGIPAVTVEMHPDPRGRTDGEGLRRCLEALGYSGRPDGRYATLFHR